MSLFCNGYAYAQAVRLKPPAGQALPFAVVDMARNGWDFMPVLGKVDTGAFRTLLTFETAQSLGIGDPRQSPLPPRKARSATGHEFTYYVHSIMVRIKSGTEGPIEFCVDAGFSSGIQNNLFGVDWLNDLCVAIDRDAVHFLRD